MNIEDLFQCPVCRNISQEEKDDFLEKSNYKALFFNKGDIIANQGEVVNYLYILLTGKVKTEMIAESGTILHIENIKAPYPLASAFLFAQNNRFPVDVIAEENSEVIKIPKEAVMRLLASNENFLKGYMAFNSNRTHFLSERIKLLSLKTIKGKLAQYILARSNNSEFIVDMNQTKLAEYFGVTRPSLARSLSEMIHNHIITLDKNKGKILDLNALKEFISQ